jgi:hypothetical protein
MVATGGYEAMGNEKYAKQNGAGASRAVNKS